MDKKNAITLILVFVTIPCLKVFSDVDLDVNRFGIARGAALDSGFVFLDNKYVEPPYTITRRGLSLYINGFAINPSDLQITKKALGGIKPPDKWQESSKAKLVTKIDYVRVLIEKNLKRGYCYFFFSDGNHVEIDPYNTAFKLPKIIADLRSEKSIDEKLKKIRPMNWNLKIGNQKVNAFVSNFSATDNLEVRLAGLAGELLRTDNFGTTTGKLAEKGFVFLNGRYLDAPYTVTRKGLAIYINNALICRPIEWPRPDLAQENDPKLPEWIVQNSVFEDIREHLFEKYHYLISRYPEEETIRRYAEYIKKLPCVKEVKFTSESSVEVTSFSGEVWPIELSSSFLHRTQRMKYDKKSVLERIEAQREYYENGLLRGECFFIFDSGEVTLPTILVVDRLPKIVQILRSSKSPSGKYADLKKLNLPITKESFSSLVTDFYASPQLEARMKGLTKRQ